MKFLKLIIFTVLFVFNSTLVNAAISDDLVSYWDFNDGSGVTLTDFQSNNDGTLANTNNNLDQGVTWTNDSREGFALQFSGVGSNKVVVPDSNDLDFGTNTDFAISVWIKHDTVNTDNFIQIVGKNNGYGTRGYNMVIHNTQDDKLRMLIDWFGNKVVQTFAGSPDLIDDAWHHLVINYDRDGDATGFVDGVNIGTIDISASNGNNISNSQDLWIGNFSLSSNKFIGVMDELAIWGRTLTENEVSSIYNNGSQGGTLLGAAPSFGVPEYSTLVFSFCLIFTFFLLYKKLPNFKRI